MTDDTQDAQQESSSGVRLRRNKRIGLGILGALVAFGAGIGAAYPIWHNDTGSLKKALSESESNASELSSKLSAAEAASTTTSESTTTKTEGGETTTPTHQIGHSVVVGSLRIRPVSFSALNTANGTTTWRATISVKNEGNTPADGPCDGNSGSLTDSEGRTYEGKAEANPTPEAKNCGEKIQPGLTQSPYMVDFKTPASAKPMTMKLWVEGNEEEAPTWSVR